MPTDQELFDTAPRTRSGAFDRRTTLGRQAFDRNEELREMQAQQDKLLSAIDSYAGQSLGSGESDNGELAFQRSRALDGYAGKMLDVPPDGRSQVNDRSIFETIQWMMPSFQRIFAGGDNVVEFDPVGPEDEEVAEQVSDYLNYMVTQRNDWDLTVREWTQDACLTKNAYCMVDMIEVKRPETEMYEGQSEDQIAMLIEDGMEIIGQRQYDNPDDPGMMLDPVTGQPIPPDDVASNLGAAALYQQQGLEPAIQRQQLYDVEVRQVEAKKVLKFNVLPPERCKVGKDTPDFTLEECNYFEYWDPECTISELRQDGYEVPDDIEGTAFEWTEEDSSRNEPLESDTQVEADDPAMKRVTKRIVWIKHDTDGDGIAEMQKVILVGRQIVDMEPATRIPVSCIVPFLNTHRHMGNSIADLVFEVQRIKTTLLRGGLDSLNLANSPRHAISKKVHLDDMLVNRPGAVVRLKEGAVPGEGHILPLSTENTFPFAAQGLEYMDRVIESRVGVNRMFQGIDSSNLNDHDRVGQLSTMAAQRIEDIARLFGSGFKRLFSLAHEALIKAGSQGEQIKLRGKWVEINPTQWRTGRDMRVTAPFAAGNKDSLLQRLLVIGNIHEKALAGGLPIVDAQDSYNLALEIAKAADLPGTKLFTDPSTIPPKPPPPDYEAIRLDIAKQEVDNRANNDEMDAANKRYEIDSDNETKVALAEIQSETQLAIAGLKGEQTSELESMRNDFKNQPVTLDNEKIADASRKVDELAQMVMKAQEAVGEMISDMSAPVKIVRKNGKIVGKEVNGKFVPLEDAG